MRNLEGHDDVLLHCTDHDTTTDLEEVTDMTALIDTTVTSVDELYALWDALREGAISDADRQEIDDIFARQLP